MLEELISIRFCHLQFPSCEQSGQLQQQEALILKLFFSSRRHFYAIGTAFISTGHLMADESTVAWLINWRKTSANYWCQALISEAEGCRQTLFYFEI